MQPYRLLTMLALLGLMPGAAAAEDEWFVRQFVPAAVAQSPAPAAPRSASLPVASPPVPVPAWRTIVIPASLAASPAPGVSAPAPSSRHAATMSSLRPLTGYAHEMRGLASYYWQEQMTSSGERFNRRDLTAAHKTLPLGTRVRVTNIANGMSTVVRINDRGPFKPGRVIDLSEAAAEQLRMTGAGIARVALDVVK